MRLPNGDSLRRDLVEVHVEVVARDAAEGDDVGLAHGAAVRQQRVADLQVLEVLAERMHARSRAPPRRARIRRSRRRASSASPAPRRAAGSACTARMPPSSSPPPARPGPPCLSCGSGEPWPVDSAAASRSSTRMRPCSAAAIGHAARGDRRVAASRACRPGCPCRARRAPAPRRGRVVGHQRADRAEGLDVVHARRRPCASRHSSSVGAKNAPFGDALAHRREAVALAEHDLVAVRQQRRRARRRRAAAPCEASAPMRTPSTDGSPTTTLASRVAQARGHRVERAGAARSRAGSRCTSGRP